MTTVSGAQSLVQEVTELQQQLRSKEAELTRAEETIRREQQQMRQLVHTHLYFSEGLPWDFPLHTIYECSSVPCVVVFRIAGD